MGPGQPRFLDANHRVVVACEETAVAAIVSLATSHDAEGAGRHGQILRDLVPFEDEFTGGSVGEGHQHADLCDHAGKFGTLVGRTEHHHPVDAGKIFLRGEPHPPPHDEVSHAVADKADTVGGGNLLDHGGQGPAVVVDAGARAGVAEGEHRGIDGFPQVLDERPHRTATFAEAVKDDHRGAADRLNPPGPLKRCQRIKTGLPRPFVHDLVARIEDAANVHPRPALQPPVVPDDVVGPLQGVGGPSQDCHPFGVGRRRCLRRGLRGIDRHLVRPRRCREEEAAGEPA